MIDSPPVSWNELQKALTVVDSEKVRAAIVLQLENRQPSAEVYQFLTRTLELASCWSDGTPEGQCLAKEKDHKPKDEERNHTIMVELNDFVTNPDDMKQENVTYVGVRKSNASVSIPGGESGYAPGDCSLFLVICDGKPCAAYPRRMQAEVYASGFSKSVEIVEGIFTAAQISGGTPSAESDC